MHGYVGRWINADGQISGVGGDIQGYNQFTYCFNNPVNMSDPTGNWPKWLKKAVKVIGKTIETVTSLALSPFKATRSSVEVGTGIGATVSANAGGINIGADIVFKATVSAESDGNKADLKYTEGGFIGVSLFENISLNLFSEGQEHSFFDNDCTCTFEEFGPNCQANTPIQNDIDPSIGISFGGYCIFGGEVSISFHPNDWFNEMHNILIDYADTLVCEGVLRRIEE